MPFGPSDMKQAVVAVAFGVIDRPRVSVAALVRSGSGSDGLAATSHVPTADLRRFHVARRLILVMALVITVAGLIDPSARLNDFEFRAADSEAYSLPGVWLFAALWLGLTAPFIYCYITLVRERLDVGEHARAVAGLIGTPLLATALFLPPEVGIVTLSATFASAEPRSLTSGASSSGAAVSRARCLTKSSRAAGSAERPAPLTAASSGSSAAPAGRAHKARHRASTG